MARLDPHSFCDTTQPQINFLDWRAQVDFSTQRLRAQLTLHLDRGTGGPLDLDTRDLLIHHVATPEGRALPFSLASPEPILGSRLRIEIPEGVSHLHLRYETSPQATALQWLSPKQTAGGVHPFLFSQCQAIHARSVLPLQDTPRVRIRYQAQLQVPRALRAVMAAGFLRREEEGKEATEHYEMNQPIAPYLLAFAVGELVARDLGPRSRVWAEPVLLDAAAREFEDVDAMLQTAESLFGPYDWERFDLLTMPPSFPYGGMENPRLTFLTPTLLAGDKSLVSVVAHELAHSWTGNLVTNASAEHFWLNEGFTVYAERRILEVLEGTDVAALHAALGRQALEEALQHFHQHPHLTSLRTHLTGVDPDEAFSQVPYEKGYLFLCVLENAVGRPRFDAFLRHYLHTYRFQALTTEEFVAFTDKELPGVLEGVNAAAYLYRPGLPEDAPVPHSRRLEAMEAHYDQLPAPEVAATWTPTEWQLFLQHLPRTASTSLLSALDQRYGLSESTNHEVLVTWLVAALRAGYAAVLPRTERLLGEMGRMKYLKPLYTALASSPLFRESAVALLAQYGERYHPVARQGVASIVARQQGRSA